MSNPPTSHVVLEMTLDWYISILCRWQLLNFQLAGGNIWRGDSSGRRGQWQNSKYLGILPEGCEGWKPTSYDTFYKLVRLPLVLEGCLHPTGFGVWQEVSPLSGGSCLRLLCTVVQFAKAQDSVQSRDARSKSALGVKELSFGLTSYAIFKAIGSIWMITSRTSLSANLGHFIKLKIYTYSQPLKCSPRKFLDFQKRQIVSD